VPVSIKEKSDEEAKEEAKKRIDKYMSIYRRSGFEKQRGCNLL
jgi:hypothetical protein